MSVLCLCDECGARHVKTGYWKPGSGIPHAGWIFSSFRRVTDLGASCGRCQMCQSAAIRYLHAVIPSKPRSNDDGGQRLQADQMTGQRGEAKRQLKEMRRIAREERNREEARIRREEQVAATLAAQRERDEAERRARDPEIQRPRWLQRDDWSLSQKGNPYLRLDDYVITVFQKKFWKASICQIHTDDSVFSPAQLTADDAKMAAFEMLVARGWVFHQTRGAVVTNSNDLKFIDRIFGIDDPAEKKSSGKAKRSEVARDTHAPVGDATTDDLAKQIADAAGKPIEPGVLPKALAVDFSEVVAAFRERAAAKSQARAARQGSSGDAIFSGNVAPWPQPMKAEAFYGIAGRLVEMIEPHTEADPNVLLMLFLRVRRERSRPQVLRHGRRRCAFHEPVSMHCGTHNSSGRKGSATAPVEIFFRGRRPRARPWKHAAESIERRRFDLDDPGRGSKNGRQQKDEGCRRRSSRSEGIDDKRLIVNAGEFMGVLQVMRRQGNTLSPVVRSAWESGFLVSPTKNSPAKATGAHVTDHRQYLKRGAPAQHRRERRRQRSP